MKKMNAHDTITENAVHKALEMVESRLQEELDDSETSPETAAETEDDAKPVLCPVCQRA